MRESRSGWGDNYQWTVMCSDWFAHLCVHIGRSKMLCEQLVDMFSNEPFVSLAHILID